MAIDETTLRRVVEASEGRCLTLWVIHLEDRYETAFGDGFYTYPQRAFFDKGVAERWAQWVTSRSRAQPHTLGFNATVQSVTLEAGDAITPQLLEQLNTGTFDWKSAVAFCVKESGEAAPDWQDPAPDKIVRSDQ